MRRAPAGMSEMATQMFRTALCDVLGIDYPIVQSGMGGVAGPEMVAEVSRAGGLGILAGLNVPPDNLRRMIRRVRELTDRPFGPSLSRAAVLGRQTGAATPSSSHVARDTYPTVPKCRGAPSRSTPGLDDSPR
jgi:NAD(P)H-dependent flavin oxidoreductase YrpB (nitropropane dioxygenase family)